MVLDKVGRRSYLGGVVAAVTSLAGCNDDGTDTEPATDTDTGGTATEATGEPTTQSLPEHDHSGGGQGGATLAPQWVDTDVYAARMPGEDLSRKVRNAIDAVPTGGAVIVTPRPDGEPWQWEETLTINLNDTGGLELLFRGTTMVEYTGDGWAIETTYRPAEYGQLAQGAFLRLRGGNWRATGSDPDGWLRMIDTNFCEIRPERVIDFANDERTATGIRVEIQDIFCESNVFSGHIAGCDVGMDFVPSDTPGIAGGEAAASFQGNLIQNVKVLNAGKYGFRWREGSLCQAFTVVNTDAFAGTNNAADEVVLYHLGGDFDGAVFVGPKTEDAGSTSEANDVNDVAYRLPESLGTPPIVIAPKNGARVDTIVDRADRYKTLPTLASWNDGRRYRAGVHDMERREGEPRFAQEALVLPAAEFHGPDSLNPDTEGTVVYHDGSIDEVPAGLYRADPENSQWVKVGEPSVTHRD